MTPTELISIHRREIIAALKTVFDPEIPTNIYDLGLIYGVDCDLEGSAYVLMTFTSPNCPAIQSMPAEIRTKVLALDTINTLDLEITWDPPWREELMSDEARLEVGLL